MNIFSKSIIDNINEIGGLDIIEETLDYCYSLAIRTKIDNSLKCSCFLDMKEFFISVYYNPYYSIEDSTTSGVNRINGCIKLFNEMKNHLISSGNIYSVKLSEIINLIEPVFKQFLEKKNIMRIA